MPHDVLNSLRKIRRPERKLGRVADEHASGFERGVQPFVRIDSHRVRSSQAYEIGRRFLDPRGDAPVCAVHMKPQVALLAEGRQIRKGSTAPVLTVPAVPTTRIGRCPSARSRLY